MADNREVCDFDTGRCRLASDGDGGGSGGLAATIDQGAPVSAFSQVRSGYGVRATTCLGYTYSAEWDTHFYRACDANHYRAPDADPQRLRIYSHGGEPGAECSVGWQCVDQDVVIRSPWKYTDCLPR